MKKILLSIVSISLVTFADAQYWMQSGGSGTVDEALAIAVDGSNNTYTTGYFTTTLTMNTFVAAEAPAV